MEKPVTETGADRIDASLPLSERIRPPQLPPLTGPAGVTWRPARVDDAEAIVGLLEAISRRDHPEWSETLDEVREEFGHSYVDPERDGVVAEAADGALVAHGLVTRAPDPQDFARVWLTGGVHPAHRGTGIGRRLLAWQRVRAEQLLAELDLTLPGWVMSYAADLAPEHGALLRRNRFEPARYFTTLHAELADPSPAQRSVPEGVTVVPWSAGLSEAARAAKNAAFADHWGSQPATRESWESWQSLPTFRPDLSRLALDGDEVVGFVTTEVNEEDWSRLGRSSGYINLVGTLRPWRGRGLATSLLAEVMGAYRRAGFDLAVLDVDTESPTGALGVYERLGFRSVTRDAAYRRLY